MKLYSNEIVFRGHPDKVSDQISDALLDAYLSGDSSTRAGIEVLGGKGKIFITGEVTSKTNINVESIVRRVLNDVGYDDSKYEIVNNIGVQSLDIAQGVDTGGAGDQGMMFGYACNETDKYLPKSMVILQELSKKYDVLRKEKPDIFYADGKAQITGYYTDDFRLLKIKDFTISYQNCETCREYSDKIIKEMAKNICDKYNTEVENFLINPTGAFNIGGFDGDAGLCLNENTLIATIGGLKKIKDIRVGQTIYTEDGIAKVTDVFCNGEKDTRIIKDTRGIEIESTLNHPFRVWDGEKLVWKYCGELKENDILVKRRIPYMNKNSKKSENVTYIKKGKKIIIRFDSNFAYLLGWLVGDGNTTAEDRITFYYGSDLEKEHLYNILIKVFPEDEIKNYDYQDDRFYVLSKEVVKELKHLGVSLKTSRYKEIPECILKATNPLKYSFLAGLFDSDGNITDNVGRDGDYLTVSLSTSSKLLAQQVTNLLYSLGIISTIDYQKGVTYSHISSSNDSLIKGNCDSYDVRLTGLNSIRKFLSSAGFKLSYKNIKYKNKYFGPKWYTHDTVNFFISQPLKNLLDLNSKKKNKYFENYVSVESVAENRNYYIENLDFILDMYAEYKETEEYKKVKNIFENFDFVKIKKIENGKSNTYDITLDDETHSFIANSFIVHNTGRKIVVDSYQSFAPVGGGAFSGKDSTKVDRSGAYKARQLAIKCLKEHNLKWCEIQLSYAIGVAEPLAIYIDSDKGNLDVPCDWYKECTPKNMIDEFKLRSPIFEETAKFGHFGNDFVWEIN